MLASALAGSMYSSAHINDGESVPLRSTGEQAEDAADEEEAPAVDSTRGRFLGCSDNDDGDGDGDGNVAASASPPNTRFSTLLPIVSSPLLRSWG